MASDEATKVESKVKFEQLVNSDVIKNYFGKNYDKWKPELDALISEKSIQDADITDAGAQKKLLQTIKFSWLGLILTYFWAAYHNAKGWLVTVSMFSALIFLDTFVLGEVIPSVVFAGVPAVIYGMYGKSAILAGKAEEIARSGNLKAPSWGRVMQALAIFVVPSAVGILLSETIL
jgi:hypothetical protein